MGGPRLRCGGGGDHAGAADSPGARRAAAGARCGGAQRPEAAPRGGALLPLPPHGHLLEIRDAPHVRPGARVHPLRAPPPPKVHHEEPAQRPPHRRRASPLLAPLLRHLPRRPHRPTQPAPGEAQAPGVSA